MITNDFAPGSPCWLDLGVPDGKLASRFYGAVLGWELEPFGDEAEGVDDSFGLFQKDGKVVAALGPLTDEDAKPAWTIYFQTPNAEVATETVARLGGTVRVPPSELDGAGTMAQVVDSLGGEFALWQPGETAGFEAGGSDGSLCWVELLTTDADEARAFYGGLFGWQTQEVAMPEDGGAYVLLTAEGLPEERVHGGLMAASPEMLAASGGRPFWHPVFAVSDCDVAVARVTESGGVVQMGPDDAEGIGRIAACADPFGADFVLLTPAEE